MFAAPELRADPELVLMAVKQTAPAYLYAADELKGDPEFTIQVLQENSLASQYVTELTIYV